MHIQKVVFPVDFSKRCESAAPVLSSIAGKLSPRVVLLHVLVPPHYEAMSLEVSGPVLMDVMANREKAIQEQLKNYLTKEFPEGRATRMVVNGDPARMIVETARKEGADLIFMPTHGYGQFRRFLLGSVTAKVLHDSEIPIMTGVHMEDLERAKHTEIRRVIAAVDLGPSSEEILRWAHGFARDAQAKLLITHVVSPADDGMDETEREAALAPLRTRLDSLQQKLGMDATTIFDWGEPAKQVCEIAQAENADLLVIGRGHKDRSLGRLRSDSYKIIRMASCPVVSV